MIRTVDYSALTQPVPPTEVKAFKASVANRPEYSRAAPIVVVIVAVLAVSVFSFFFLGIIGVMLTALSSTLSEGGAAFGIGGFVFLLVFIAVFVLIAIVVFRNILGGGGRWERWYRLDRFAAANGLVFSPSSENPQYPGAIFSSGRNRQATDHLRSASDRFLDYGNYTYITGSGKNSTTHRWGFMALHLDRALPNMVLDSKANNGLFGSTNLPATFTKDQVLSLEGNFNEYFTLYCPKQYERDALYVFTPDLMALLIDNAAPFDVEIVDQWMFVYSAAQFDLRQPAIHQRLLQIVDTVGAKTLSQTDRYVDERIGTFADNVVAPQGQRLKRGVSVAAIVVGALFLLGWLWPVVAGLLDAVLP